jgi:transposase
MNMGNSISLGIEPKEIDMETHKINFDQTVSVGCGIDVHKAIIVATISKGQNDYQTREFDAFTSSLTALRDWCKQERVTHVAMESTGVYWKPVFNILEEDFEVILVNARHVKNVPGQKTDKKDSKWLAKLLLAGLLKASFIPPSDIRELRDSVRYHQSQVQEVTREKNRAIKILEDANIKLSMVLTDVHGSSGTKIMRDLANGITDPKKLLKHIHGNVKKPKEEIEKSLEGRVTKHHRFMLKLILDGIETREKQLATLEQYIDTLAAKYALEIELLQTIDGVGKDSAISIISEIGVNMDQFHNEQALSSWAGLCPGSNESAGKKKAFERPRGTDTLDPD